MGCEVDLRLRKKLLLSFPLTLNQLPKFTIFTAGWCRTGSKYSASRKSENTLESKEKGVHVDIHDSKSSQLQLALGML